MLSGVEKVQNVPQNGDSREYCHIIREIETISITNNSVSYQSILYNLHSQIQTITHQIHSASCIQILHTH